MIGRPTLAAICRAAERACGIAAIIRYFDRDYWQMREALGYPMPYWVQRRWPRQFQDGGTNPYFCGSCEARKRYPELHGVKKVLMTVDAPC